MSNSPTRPIQAQPRASITDIEVNAAAQEYRAPDTHSKSDLSLCATLLSLFDFSASGHVTRLDWDRGLSTLLLGGLSADESLWIKLLDLYDPGKTGNVQLQRVRDLLPIDPRISVLLQQLVHSVAGCREYVANATKKQEREVEMRSQRAVINLRKRLLQPIFSGWLEVVTAERKLRIKAARYLKNQSLGRAYRSWRELIEDNAKAQKQRQRMGRVLRRMQHRGIARALNAWLDLLEERARMRKLAKRALGGPLTRAWNQWVGVAEQTARLRAVLNRGLNPQLTQGFFAIKQCADDTQRLRSIGARALGGPLVRAFNTWLDALGDLARMRRFARRAINRGLARALARWMELLDERAVLAKYAKRVLSRDLYKGWSQWQDMLAERRRIRGIGARLRHAGVARAWNAWVGLGGALRRTHPSRLALFLASASRDERVRACVRQTIWSSFVA